MYIIDVSQSVEHDHPYAFDFLRADITHVDDYFTKRGGVQTLGLRNTFEWIIKPPQTVQTIDEAKEVVAAVGVEDKVHDKVKGIQLNTLDTLASGPFSKVDKITRRPGETDEDLTKEVQQLLLNLENSERGTQEQVQMAAEDQAVFRQAYIPQTLTEVVDPERDIDRRNQGGENQLIYSNVIGIGASIEEVKNEKVGDQSESESESEGDTNSDEEGEEDGSKTKAPRGHRHEDRDAKKVRIRVGMLS